MVVMLRWSMCVGMLACITACGGFPQSPAVEATQLFAAESKIVLAAAEEILARQGYVFETAELNDGMLVGQQVETVRGTGRDAYLKGSVIRTQVVVEAAPAESGTEVLASFNINVQRATGERRTWSPETPQASRLRRQFYSELQDELSGSFTYSSFGQ